MPGKNALKTLLGISVITAACIAVYANSLRNDFAFDEYILITENYSIRQLKNIPEFFISKFWPGQARGIYYRPVITTSYALDYSIGKTAPLSYHATNLAFHIINCMLILFLLRRLEIKGAYLAALVFALHPVHTESVTWISGRTDVIAVFFMLCAWLAWIEFSRDRELSSPGKKTFYVAVSILAYVSALLSKEIAVAFPFLLLLFELTGKNGPRQNRSLINRKAFVFMVLLGLTAIYLLVRYKVIAGPGPEPAPAFFSGHSFWTRIGVMALVWMTYLSLLFVPHQLRLDYFYSEKFQPEAVSCAAGWFAALLILSVLVFTVLNRRRFPMLARLLLGGAISIIPFSHLVSIPTLMAERFMYLPSLFACAAVAWLIVLVSERNKISAYACTFCVLLFFSSLTICRNADWRDGYSFWRVSVRQVPELPEGRNLMGIFAARKGMLKLATHEYRAALELEPSFSQAKMNLSQLYLQTGDLDLAEKLLLEVIDEIPTLSSAHYNLGLVYRYQNKPDRAMKTLKKAVELEPDNLPAHFQLGEILMRKKDGILEAERHFMKTLELDPAYLPSITRLAELALSKGNFQQAEEWIKRGLAIDPGDRSLISLQQKMGKIR